MAGPGSVGCVRPTEPKHVNDPHDDPFGGDGDDGADAPPDALKDGQNTNYNRGTFQRVANSQTQDTAEPTVDRDEFETARGEKITEAEWRAFTGGDGTMDQTDWENSCQAGGYHEG
jgi:hypothetical protein